MRLLRRSLLVKLTLVVVSTSLISVGLVAVLTRWILAREFNLLARAERRADFTQVVADYYRVQGTWQGVMAALPPPPGAPPPSDQRATPSAQHPPAGMAEFALLDQQGCVVVPADRFFFSRCDIRPTREEQTPVVINGETVGMVITVSNGAALSTVEQVYLRRINRAIFWSALGATGLALLLGIFFARSLTRPLRLLINAVHALARGDLNQAVPITTQDELGELTAAFNQMSTDLAHANQARRQMTADIAHELRNPLMVMSGYLEAMRDEVLKPTPERLGALHDEAQHLQRLVADLRTLSLADAGELSLQLERVAPAELLVRVAKAYQTQAHQKQIGLRVKSADPLPEIRVDPERMGQVLNNLVSNALRYTPPGGEIELSGWGDTHRVSLLVRDTGEGIPTDALPQIFDRLYRVDPSRQQNGGESGLGLAIAKSIVSAHGGEIMVESAVGAGTTFTIGLPVAR